ncbi:MAG: hypothetical protein IJW30_03645 [Clostridia bacterium]|nr:hypothetical protein [Clostridia bacterium]
MKQTVRYAALLLCLLTVLAVLCSCGGNGGKPAADYNDAKAALEKNGYKVILTVDEKLLPYSTMTASVSAYHEEDVIIIYYFETAEDAEEAWKDLKKLSENYEVCAKDGSMIWHATSKKCVKAAR